MKLRHILLYSSSLFLTIIPWSTSQAEILPPANFNKGIEFGNIVNQGKLINKLIQSGVPLYVSNEGVIYYSDTDKSFVENIKTDEGLTHTQFEEKKYATIFITLLELHSIRYVPVNYCNTGTINVYYDIKNEKIISDTIMPEFLVAIREGIEINVEK